MPKYKPTQEDLYTQRSCPICGMDILEDGTDACPGTCQSLWVDYLEHFDREFEDWIDKCYGEFE